MKYKIYNIYYLVIAQVSALPSFAESDYDIEDWIPVAETFDEHSRVQPRGAFENHADAIRGDVDSLPDDISGELDDRDLEQIENPEQLYEMEMFYDVADTSGEINTWYSPSKRQEGDILEGILTFAADVEGRPVSQVHQKIVEEYSTPYLQANKDTGVEGNATLASIQIPENYNPETLEDTIQAIVNIYDEAERFDDTITETVENYEIN